jgi:hypothetical protein
VNTLLGILCIEYSFYLTRPLWKVNEERDSKYPAFRRTDIKHWKRWRLYLGKLLPIINDAIGAPFLMTKFIISIVCLILIIGIAKYGTKFYIIILDSQSLV